MTIASIDSEDLEIALGALASDSPLWSSCDYIASNPGKRFRAAVLECAARYGERPDDPLVRRCAVAIELFHAATLAHDDVIDSGDLRRGRKTIGAHAGNLAASLSGGWLFARSGELVAAGGAEVTTRFAATTSVVCEGEMLESRDLYDVHRSRDAYLAAIEAKTARLIAFAAWLGATVGGAGPVVAERLERYGLAVGMAFQIADDILDLLADPVATGKTKGSDLRGGVYTLPTIHAVAVDEELCERLEAGVEEADCEELVERIRATGAVEKSLAESSEWIDRALDALPQAIPPAAHEQQLLSLARGVGARAEEMVEG
jgi:geranylgeranyl pyrophosphate synthase